MVILTILVVALVKSLSLNLHSTNESRDSVILETNVCPSSIFFLLSLFLVFNCFLHDLSTMSFVLRESTHARVCLHPRESPPDGLPHPQFGANRSPPLYRGNRGCSVGQTGNCPCVPPALSSARGVVFEEGARRRFCADCTLVARVASVYL